METKINEIKIKKLMLESRELKSVWFIGTQGLEPTTLPHSRESFIMIYDDEKNKPETFVCSCVSSHSDIFCFSSE